MSIWTSILELVKTGQKTIGDAEQLIGVAVHVYHDVKTGGSASALESIQKNFPDALPVIEKFADLLMPGSGTAIEIFAHLMAFSHKMTPAEEKTWFDRASASGS